MSTTKRKEIPHGLENGRAFAATLPDLIARAHGTCPDESERAFEEIQTSPLSIEVRSGWTLPGRPLEREEYCILLTTGGPALRIIGTVDNGEPADARLEWQDWGKPWAEVDDYDSGLLLDFARICVGDLSGC